MRLFFAIILILFIVIGLSIYFLIHKKYKKSVILIVFFVIFAVLMYFALPFFITSWDSLFYKL